MRTVEDLTKFINTGYHNSTGQPIPPPKTQFQIILSYALQAVDVYVSMLDKVGLKSLPRKVKVGIVIAFFLLPVVLIIFFMKTMVQGPAPAPTPTPTPTPAPPAKEEVKKEENTASKTTPQSGEKGGNQGDGGAQSKTKTD